MSLEQQEAVCRDYCHRLGYVVVDVVADPGVSGSRTRLAKRRGVQQALGLLDSGDAAVLVCWKFSRIARNRLDFELAKERIAKAGGRLESATEPNDITATGRFATGMLAEVAAFEAARIGEDWRMTHARRRNAGVPAQGGRRYGYNRIYDDRGRTTGYEVNSAEADVLRWMYRQVIDGRGAAWVAAELNRQGVPNPVGNLWAQTRVYPLLDSGFPAGLIVHRERDDHGNPLHERAYYDAAHEPIIDRATWDAYRATRRQTVSRPSRTIEARYPLTGLTRCGDCGSSMWPARAKGKGPGHVLVCGRWQSTRQARCVTVARYRAEDAVKEWLGGYIADLERQARTDEAAQARMARARRDEKAARRQVTAIEEKLSRLSRAWLDGTVPDVGYAATRDELLDELKQAQADVQAAEDEHVVRRPISRGEAQTLLDEWHKLPAADVRNTLRHLIDHVLVTPPERSHGRSTVTVVAAFDDTH